MKTIKKVKEDLSEIKYYYSKIKDFEKISVVVGESDVCKLVARYNKVIRRGSIKFYDLYVSLYVNNNSLSVVAEDWGINYYYVSRLNKQLCDFFVKEFNKEDEADVL
jgi:hypothetical protein